MSKAQFGLGFHKGKNETQEQSTIWEKQNNIAEIDFVLTGLSQMLQEVTLGILKDEYDNDSEITTLSKAIFMLNGKKMREKKMLQEYLDMPKKT
jgi:hypothetical protein